MIGVPRPKSYPISALEPDFPAHRHSLNKIKALWNAFHKLSKNYHIDFCDIRPVLGDFKIIHRFTGEESHVEEKTDHCRLVRGEETGGFLLQHSQKSCGSSDRAVFTWKAQWDFLYASVISSSGPSQALFVPRDKIPKSWWNHPLSNEDVWLTWSTAHTHPVEEYLINTTSDRRLVYGMERILNQNPKKAQEPIKMAFMEPAALLETNTRPNDNQPAFAGEHWNSSTYRRGHGSAAHPGLKGESYHLWASEVLLELCRAR